MSQRYYNVEDIIRKSGGIFDGETAIGESGLGAFDTAQTTQTQSGVVVNMQCRHCGRPAQVEVEYMELVAVKYAVPPQYVFQGTTGLVQYPSAWVTSAHVPGSFAPNVPCGHCNQSCLVWFSPEEAEGHLAKARRSGWIRLDVEQAVAQRAAQVAQALRARAAGG